MGDREPQGQGAHTEYSGVIDQHYYLERANEAFAEDDYEKALAFYSRTLQYDISMEEGWLGQLRCLIELGELPEAVIWSNRAFEKFPKSASILAARAVAEARSGRSGAAIQYSDSAFSNQGVGSYAWVARGEVLLATSAANAKACFTKAVEISPNDWSIRSWIARAYMTRRCYHQALEHLNQAVKLDPERFTCWYRIGKCSEALGQLDEAQIAYRRALATKPSFKKAQHALREIGEKGPISKAIDGFRRLFGLRQPSGG